MQFYWDRKKKPSRRVRVAQIWAGSNRGALFTPRVGDEVLIQYEEGDPDRPIVVGSVYNGHEHRADDLARQEGQVRHPHAVEHRRRRATTCCCSTTRRATENVKLRTQKDLKFKALNDQEIDIGVDQTEKVGNNIDQTVGTNHTINVGTKYALTAGSQIVLTVGSSSITITPSSITLQSTQINLTADAEVSISAPQTSITA